MVCQTLTVSKPTKYVLLDDPLSAVVRLNPGLVAVISDFDDRIVTRRVSCSTDSSVGRFSSIAPW